MMNSSEMPVGFGIVGCGLVSPFHARAICATPGAALIGFYDLLHARAEQRAAEFGVEAFPSLASLLQREDVHVINVCTPNGRHEEIVLQAAAAGKHVMVEKPPELSLAKTDRMIAACKNAGVKLATVLQTRFRPPLVAIKRGIDSREFGRPMLATIYMKWYRSRQYYRRDAWRGSREFEGGALMQLGFHYVDQLLYLMGPVKSVTARTARLLHKKIETEDTGLAIFEFESGALGYLETTTAAAPGIDVRLEICGSRGMVRLEGERIVQWHTSGHAQQEKESELGRRVQTAAAGAADFDWHEHQWQIQDMVEAIRSGHEPSIRGEDGRNALEVVLAIHESARREKTLYLPFFPDANPHDVT